MLEQGMSARSPEVTHPELRIARHLRDVKYEIRGPLARRAQELELRGHEIIKLNIGNPAVFGIGAPESLRRAIVENLAEAEGYCHQKGILSAREAVAADARAQGIRGVTPEDVFMGNGVSELILMTMEALLEPGDEVLLPAPDYPLWSAAVLLANGKPVYYPCRPGSGFVPDPHEVSRLVGPRTKALVLINPNNPTGAVYPRKIVEGLVRIAEQHGLLLLSDEIYNRILYEGAEHVPAGSLCGDTVCGTLSGLSKVHRACGLRAGWVTFSGNKRRAREYMAGLELLASLRLCANVPAQLAVATALSDTQSIYDLTAPNGRLGRQRQAVIDGVSRSPYLSLERPMGAMYAFVRVTPGAVPAFEDMRFAMALLEEEHVLLVPGCSFNVDYRDHFRITLLPDEATLAAVFGRIDSLLSRLDWTTHRSSDGMPHSA